MPRDESVARRRPNRAGTALSRKSRKSLLPGTAATTVADDASRRGPGPVEQRRRENH